jgi:hypothetical protein
MITVFVIDVRFRNIFRITKMLFAFCRHRACAAPENKLVRTVNHWHTLEHTPWLSGPLTMLELASESAASALAEAAAGPARGVGDSTLADALYGWQAQTWLSGSTTFPSSSSRLLRHIAVLFEE